MITIFDLPEILAKRESLQRLVQIVNAHCMLFVMILPSQLLTLSPVFFAIKYIALDTLMYSAMCICTEVTF